MIDSPLWGGGRAACAGVKVGSCARESVEEGWMGMGAGVGARALSVPGCGVSARALSPVCVSMPVRVFWVSDCYVQSGPALTLARQPTL